MEFYFRNDHIGILEKRLLSILYCFCFVKIPLTLIDSYYYGQLVIAPLNHIRYNIFSKHGPTLYGNEMMEILHFKDNFISLS